MENSGHVSLSQQLVLRRELDVIANNLANMNTNAFRGQRMAFVEHLTEAGPGQQTFFVQGLATVRDLSEGQAIRTSNNLDVAISGEGYFEVEGEDGPLYTRDGAFGLNEEGQLVTRDGLPVLGNGGSPINLSAATGPVTISASGTISIGQGPLGQLTLVRFENEQNLARLPGGLYDANGEEPQEAEDAKVLQGHVEGSNVVGITEMARMMKVVRAYKLANTVSKEEDKRQRKAIEVLGARMMV